jgi:hypothetical protein
MKNSQHSSQPLLAAWSLYLSSKIEVMSAKNSRKKGKTAPDIIDEMEPIIRRIL